MGTHCVSAARYERRTITAPETLTSRQTRITHRGLRLDQGMTFSAWCNIGHSLRVLSDASAWCLGDWLIYGERAYGQRYKEALELTGLDYQTLRNYAWVARRFPMSRRRDGASFQHHAEVAALPEAVQDLLLERSERFRWSRAELRRHTRKFRHAEISANGSALPHPPDSVEVALTINVAAEREQRWRQAAADAGQSVDQWITYIADAAAAAALEPSPATPVALTRR